MKDRRIAAALFFLAWVTFAWFFGGAGWNQDAHFDLTRALVVRHTLYIDGYDVNTGDVSRGADGHTYINKPPGVSFLAAIPYAIVFAGEKELRLPIDRMARTNAWITTAATCGIAGALIGPLLYLYGRRRARTSAVESLSVSLAIVFGTIVFPYSTMLFAHVPAALFLLIATTLVDEHPLVAGIAAGVAGSCFYICGIAAVILALVAMGSSVRNALRFVGGAFPFAIAMGLYQWRCFGSPFRTAVEASVMFTEKGLLFGVLGLPSPHALYGISFSPYRGLFFCSPVLLFALAGGIAMIRDRSRRRELVAVSGIAVVFFMVIASFNGWSGSWAFGPRYLLPIVPLLGIPMFYAARFRSRGVRALWIVAALLSLTVNFIATASDPMPSPQVHDPIRTYLLPAFFTGRIPEQTRAAFPWYESTHVDKVSLPREAGNLGEFVFGEGTRSSVMPIALWLTAGSAILLLAGRRSSSDTLLLDSDP